MTSLTKGSAPSVTATLMKTGSVLSVTTAATRRLNARSAGIGHVMDLVKGGRGMSKIFDYKYDWKPTARLRYIDRGNGQLVLQQLWTLDEFEKWADVPLEEFP